MTGSFIFGTETRLSFTPRAVLAKSLLFRSGCEAYGRRAYDAGLLHRNLQILPAEPGAGLRHVGYILKDYDIIRVVRAAEHAPIRDARRKAALLVLIVAPAPRGVILDFVADREIFG